MIYKLLNISLNQLIGRTSFILMNLLMFVYSIYAMIYLFDFVSQYNHTSDEKIIEEVNKTLNGIAGILVALGVVMECRKTIMEMIDKPITQMQEYLNEVAEYNGIGLLIIGLFMEIATAAIETPNAILNTKGIEVYLFWLCFGLIAIAMVVEIDFIKDYIKSFFIKVKSKHSELEHHA